MLRRFSIQRVVGFFLVDWLGTIGAFLIATFIRANLNRLGHLAFVDVFDPAGSVWVEMLTATSKIFYLPVLFAVVLIWPFFLIVFSIYNGRRNSTFQMEIINLFSVICISIITLTGFLYFSYRDTPRLLVIIFFVTDITILIGSRVLFALYRHYITGPKTARQRNVIVIGAGPVGRKTVRELMRYAWANLHIYGYLDDDEKKLGKRFEGIPVIGNLDEIENIVRNNEIKEAVVALPLRAHERLINSCHRLQKAGVGVHVIPDLFALSFPNASLDGFGGIAMIHLGNSSLGDGQRLAKRIFDVFVASLLLILFSPILIFVAIAIKIESDGPIIFKQTRIGENGRPFTMLKFRSMFVDMDDSIHRSHMARIIRENITPEQLGNGNSLKLADDPRVTKIGRFIRKSSLDEFPQLFNVLRGEMSLVGPRPPLPYELELYQEWHMRRLETLPGITGLWQVKGRNRVSFDEMVRMDLEYVEHQSLWTDVVILLQTPFALISTRGAG